MILRLAFFFISSTTLSIVHWISMTLSLYWTYLWLDMPMHFFGGICVALGYSIIPFFGVRMTPRYQTVYAYLAFVLLVGISWEIFEYMHDISLVSAKEIFWIDTSIDLFLDLLGGYLGYLIASRL